MKESSLVVDVHKRHSDSVSSSRQELFHEDCCEPAIISALSDENDRRQGLQNPIVRIARTSISCSMLQVWLVIVVTKWKITMTPKQTIRRHSVRSCFCWLAHVGDIYYRVAWLMKDSLMHSFCSRKLTTIYMHWVSIFQFAGLEHSTKELTRSVCPTNLIRFVENGPEKG